MKRFKPSSVILSWLVAAPLAFAQDATAPDTNAGLVAPPADTNTAPAAQPAFQNAPASLANTNAAPNPAGQIVVTTPAAARFDSAMNFYNAGQYADAVTAFSDFIANFPQDRHREEALFRLAESYRNLNHTDDALAAYTYQVENYPDGPLRVNAELQRGAILFDAGKFADAVAPLQYVVDKGSGQLQEAATYFLGRSLISTQKEPDGRKLLQPLVDAQPPGKFGGDAAQTLAELDDNEGNATDALTLWKKAANLSTDTAVKATAAARGGWSAIAAKQPKEAEALFELARANAASGETRKVANTGLLRVLYQQKRYIEWTKIYAAEKDNLLDNARSEILYDLGHASFVLKRWSDAIAAFDQYLAAFGSQDAAVTAAYERFLAIAQYEHNRTVAEAEAYVKAWPKSPYLARVHLLEAQELTRDKKYLDALPLWTALADEPASESWPHREILLELARTYDELGDFPKAATAYQNYLDEINTHPLDDKTAQATELLQTQARLAVCLQKSNQLLAATDAWKAVQALAPDGSPEQEAALEALGLIYANGGPNQETLMADTFHKLLDRFPQTPLRALAAFSVGDHLFKTRDYAGAEPYLLDAREWDAKTWQQPATQRLALAAYGMKDRDKALLYMKEYDSIPGARKTNELPAAFYYWLADDARQAGKLELAEALYPLVIKNPEPGDLLAGAWWQLGEVQGKRGEWPAAVASYEAYRTAKPDAKDATTVLLALGRAELGAQQFDAAKKLGDQALLQEPEGPRSAAARILLGETAFATQNYAEAARMFATTAVLFDDPTITPQAMARAADAFALAGDSKSAADWQQKLKAKYPRFQEASYL
jgi:TolA-binding protein